MAVSSLSDEDYPDSNFGFPDFRPPSTFDHDVEAAASTDQDVQRAVVVEEKERIFNPIVGGHLNFSSNLYDEDYPVRNTSIVLQNVDFEFFTSLDLPERHKTLSFWVKSLPRSSNFIAHISAKLLRIAKSVGKKA